MAKNQGRGVVLGYLRYVLGFDSLAFQEGLGDAEKRLKAAQKSIEKTAAGFDRIGKSLSTYVTLPIAGAAAAIIKMGGDFEASMNKVSISTQGTAEEMKAMNDLALKLGKDTVFGASDAADAMDMLAKNGLEARQILDGAATAAVNLASAAGSELSPAANAITDVMAQFKLTTGQLPEAVNQITGAVNASKMDFSDYALAIAQAGGVAGAVGVDFKDFNAALAATSSLFASGSDAGTSFKTFLLALPGNSKQAIEAIKQYGLQFYDANGGLRSMAEIAEELRTKLGGLNDQAKTDVMKTIFGTDAMRTAIGLMDQGAAGLDKVAASIVKTDAAAQSDQRLKGFNGQMKQLKGALETLAIRISQSGLLEFVTRMVEKLTGFVDRLSEMNPELLKWGTGIALVAAALGPVVVVLGSVISAFGTILPLIVRIVPLFTAFGSILSTVVMPILATLGRALIGLAIAGGPLTLIAAAATAVYLVWKNWDTIGPIIQKLYIAVKTWLLDKLGMVWDGIKAKIESVGKWFFNLYDAVVGHSYVPDMVDGIALHFGRLNDVMVKPTEDAVKASDAAFSKLGSSVQQIMDRLFPLQALMRQARADKDALDKAFASGAINKGTYQNASALLEGETEQKRKDYFGYGTPDTWLTANDTSAIDMSAVAKAANDNLDKISRKFAETGKSGGEAMVDMVNKSLNALSNLAQSIKSGGILDIMSNLFNAFGSLSQSGLFGSGLQNAFKGFTAISGFREAGGSVSGGKSYVVGEKGPEIFTASRSGYITSNDNLNGRSQVQIVPSPYFDVVVDGRAANVAAPMSVNAAQAGSVGAQRAMARRSKWNLGG